MMEDGEIVGDIVSGGLETSDKFRDDPFTIPLILIERIVHELDVGSNFTHIIRQWA
jgi:hypothetical protein